MGLDGVEVDRMQEEEVGRVELEGVQEMNRLPDLQQKINTTLQKEVQK